MKSSELAMMVAIGLLLTVTLRLESIDPGEYSPLPSMLLSDGDNEKKVEQWEDAAQTTIISSREGKNRLRVRLILKEKDGREAKGHAAFIVNRESWIDGGDGWLYYRDTLEKNEMTDPICLQGYLDRQGIQKQIYATLVCDWQAAEKSTG